LMEKLNL